MYRLMPKTMETLILQSEAKSKIISNPCHCNFNSDAYYFDREFRSSFGLCYANNTAVQ